MSGTFRRRCLIPSNYITDKKTKKIVYDPVDPVGGSVVIGTDKIDYWTKPLVSALNFAITSCLGVHNNVLGITKFDLVMGGDHGQREFQMVIKIIARSIDDDIVDHWVIKVAHIDCVKDAYQVLKETIMVDLNNSLKKLLKDGMKVCLFKTMMIEDTGQILQRGDVKYVFQLSDTISFIYPSTNFINNNYTSVQSTPLCFVITSDLAFYASCLGITNMSSTWCSWCDNSRNEWVEVDHVKGVQWTSDLMKTRRDDLHMGLLKDKSNNRRGCVDVE